MSDPAILSSIPDLLACQSRRCPDSTALLTTDGDVVTYGALFDLHVRTVHDLAALGLGWGDRIALVLPDGLDMAAAFLAISGAAACAPLNPAYRAEDFDFYLADVRARAVVLIAGRDSPARSVAAARGIPVFELEAGSAASGRLRFGAVTGGSARKVRPCEPGDVALVLHTSGTTSRPKIVPLTHANVCSSAYHIASTLGLTPADRCLNVMPLFHIHGLIGAILSSLAGGASVVCTPGFRDACFFDWVERFRPTWYTGVPTMHQAVLARAAEHGAVLANHTFRFIRSCSAALSPTLMADMERVFSAPVIEAYGMTEAAHQMASNPLPPKPRKPGSVGPAAGPEVAIMDQRGTLLEKGCEGEIAIRGPNVMALYENNADANAASFTNGWFRTGDQGYLDADGYLFISGRIKEMINRGGEKIAPREIDDALLAHPAVLQAVAFALPHDSLGEDVAAAVVPRPGTPVSEAGLRQFLLERLPPFKVPSRIVVISDIPKGPTGKIQRIGMAKRLGAALAVAYEKPIDDTEELVASVFGAVLGRDRVGRTDNFFALGGDSIRAVQVSFRLQEALGVQLSFTALFQNPTSAALAAEIKRMQGNSLDQLAADLERLSPEDLSRILARSSERPS